MKRGTPDHPKMHDLSQRLGIPRSHACGIMEMLWHYAGKFAPQGDIGRASNYAIAAAVDWRGEPDELVEALVHSRWLDPCRVHRLVIHDFEEHAEDSVKKYLRTKHLPFVQAVTDQSGEMRSSADFSGEIPPSRARQGASGKGLVDIPESKTNAPARVYAESGPALSHDVEPQPVENVSEPHDPFVAAGFESDFHCGQWWRALLHRHPNKNRNGVAFSKLRDLIFAGKFNRKEFEDWYELAKANPRWHEQGGNLCPNLFSILDDGLCGLPPPDFSNPAASTGRKSLMDGV